MQSSLLREKNQYRFRCIKKKKNKSHDETRIIDGNYKILFEMRLL